MIPNFHTHDEDVGTVFRDVILVIMLTFVVLFLAALIHINPVAKNEEDVAKPPGNVQVDISWRQGSNVDVDLWVKGPTDALPVGYSNRAGFLFNLLRDDLGTVGDTTPLNYENAYTHGVDSGEYIVNVHLYNARDGKLPIDVIVVVKYSVCAECRPEEIIARTVQLTHPGHQVTVIRFHIEGGEYQPDKTNFIPIELRSSISGDRDMDHGF